MRAVILFDAYGEALATIPVNSRDEVRQVILGNTELNLEHNSVDYAGENNQNRGMTVDSAVFIDTEAGTSEEFKLSARITAEIIIT